MLKKLTLSLLLLLASAGVADAGIFDRSPVSEDVRYCHLWQMPSGRVDMSTGEPLYEQEKINRAVNFATIFNCWRFPLDVTKPFNPDDGNQLLGYGWTYRDALTLANDVRMPIVVDYIIHATGGPAGSGYHSQFPPEMRPNVVSNRAESFLNWVNTNLPDLEIIAWQVGNEVDYDPTGTYTHEKWLELFLSLKPLHPQSWARFSGGNSGFEFKNGNNYTHNGWLAATGYAQLYDIILDVHGNGLTRSELREELQYLSDRYSVEVALLEDRPPYSKGHNNAKERAQDCYSSGVRWCSVFGARDSGRPQLTEGCNWGTSGNKPERWDIGLEGCYREKRRGQDGLPNNIIRAIRASKFLGVFVEGSEILNWDAPGPPPADDPCDPTLPGLHQELSFTKKSMEAAGYPFPNPSIGKCDPDVRFAYCKKLQFQNANVQCPDNF